MRIFAAGLVAAAASLAVPGIAMAAPPSGVEEYVLDIPGAGGSEHPAPGAGARSADERNAEAPAGAGRALGPEEPAAGEDGVSPLAALARELTGAGSGIGPLLASILWLTAAAAVVTVVARRRRERSETGWG